MDSTTSNKVKPYPQGEYILSCTAKSGPIVVAVAVNDDGLITIAPPIARKFVGQPLSNLKRRMKSISLSRDFSLQRITRDPKRTKA